MLKTVNAPFFGLLRKISSLAHAVDLLGMDTTAQLRDLFAPCRAGIREKPHTITVRGRVTISA